MYSDDIAWDWINEKLYFTDACANELEVYDSKSGNRRVLIEGLENAHGIVVDPHSRFVFHTLLSHD